MANDVSKTEPFSEKLRVPEALTFDDVLLIFGDYHFRPLGVLVSLSR